MAAVRWMKIALLVSTACNSSIDRLELVEKRLALLEPAGRQVGRHAAGRDVAVRQPGAAGLLEQVENLLPLAERVQKRREDCPGPARSVPAATRWLAIRFNSAMITRRCRGLLGQFQPQQLLDGQGPAEIHVHPGQVVHAVGVGDPLPRRETFSPIFSAERCR